MRQNSITIGLSSLNKSGGRKVHKRKFFILLTPTIIIGIFLIYYLPRDQKYLALIVPIIFRMIYYTWILIDRKKEEKLD